MKAERKIAREFLKKCNREEYEKAIYRSKITPLQEQIANLHFLQDKSICSISLQLSCCESLIKNHLGKIYDKIYLLCTLSNRISI